MKFFRDLEGVGINRVGEHRGRATGRRLATLDESPQRAF